MKKTRKQTALAKCVLATIMAMGMMGYTTVWAEDTVTPTPSPIDKTVSKDAAGHIYDASHNYGRGYFWTDLGHAQVQIGSDKQIELFTPFIYHTNNAQWENGGANWSPVHEGDNSEMQCEESMSNITVGEFDRIIKSLYTNDITMAKTIYGEEGQAGLQDKLIKEVMATAGQGAIVNTYTLVRENGTEVETSIVDTNTITTVADDENGYVTVSGGMGEDGNYNYTVGFDETQLDNRIAEKDKYVIGGSISNDGKISLNLRNVEAPIELTGQLKDAQLTEIARDKEAGTATLVVKDGYTNDEVRRLKIEDIASKEQNDRDHAEFREHFNELDHRVDSLGSRVDKVGAGAAALAALHPMDFDPDDKLTFAAGYGNYKGKNAAAVGAFYRPDEKVMFSIGGTFGNGENMVNAGISFSLDRTARVSNSRTAMAKEIVDLRANVANLTALVGQLTAGMGGTIEMDRMKLFPDVPENHWAYEYIGRLAAAGIIEGYPDGMFNGNRMMSRYEFAAMLYRALEKGVKLDHKLVREFEPEMGRIHVARISGADGDRGKIERVRVYGGDNRDHYGSKLK
ncbi:S-layer homology domain-containing protein [uncultured Phascolarctobacterium sp.]|uniref:S-layer homology domain-containing protein n=1 Tax=uncultured Phascolarctobacterium sp. TaxID=512296 RepID=UPI0025CE0F7D|nr:S-layer homology domain-containing protein [uncultured Phascolarctobacterium sp.]